jgi:hypothetical protein
MIFARARGFISIDERQKIWNTRSMRKKQKKKMAVSKRVPGYQVLSRITIITFGMILVLASFLFSQAQSWFFLTTTKEKVDVSALTGAFDSKNIIASYGGATIPVPRFQNQQDFIKNVLGDSTVQKRIEVDLTNQRVYAFENDKKIYDFLISSGKWYPTPTGTFQIWGKFRYVHMIGGNKAIGTYYDLPNVPYVMFFYNV